MYLQQVTAKPYHPVAPRGWSGFPGPDSLWEVHRQYLEVDGPVALVNDAGLMQVGRIIRRLGLSQACRV